MLDKRGVNVSGIPSGFLFTEHTLDTSELSNAERVVHRLEFSGAVGRKEFYTLLFSAVLRGCQSFLAKSF